VQKRVKSLERRIDAVRREQPVLPPTAVPPAPAVDPMPPIVNAQAASNHETGWKSIAPWVVGVVGVSALAAGFALNLTARSKMRDCRSLAIDNDIDGARSACDSAKPLAHASYVLFGAAGLAAIVDVGLILARSSERGGVSMTVQPGGGTLAWSGRF